MCDEIVEPDVNPLQVGPERKEFGLLLAKQAFDGKRLEHTIFYLVRSLFRAYDARYACETKEEERRWPAMDDLVDAFSEAERDDFKENTFMQEAVAYCRAKEQSRTTANLKPDNPIDFLADVVDPDEGFRRISEVCSELPKEWCIVQFCKGFDPQTTLRTYREMHRTDSDIYLSVLRHCRSPELPPFCVHFPVEPELGLFENFARIPQRLKECINIDPKTVKTAQAKQKYWHDLSEFNKFLESCIRDLRHYFYPLTYLLFGQRYYTPANEQLKAEIFGKVDAYCTSASLDTQARVLLSQAALHASHITTQTLIDIISLLNVSEAQADEALRMLNKCGKQWEQIEQAAALNCRRYPCILLIDERLDHFLWEELAVKQEFTRVKSLHALLRLYNCYKTKIKHGYYSVNLQEGYCLLNPDKNLPNASMRLNSFFQYWMPHWELCVERRPAANELLNVAYRKDCFIYAGHGSGLQYLSGRQVARARVNSVVFLFGCDSSRMCSNGLYSTMIDAHVYYQAAFCPTMVGTLMSALDANMDTVSTELLSRWIAPKSPKVLPWNTIERSAWLQRGQIKAPNTGSATSNTKAQSTSASCSATTTTTNTTTTTTTTTSNLPTMADTPDYHIGSLCSILSRIHQRLVDPRAYNSCIYVCRGLPAWNCDVEAFPSLRKS